MQSQKVLKLLLIIGLPITLLMGLVLMFLFRNNKANLINRFALFLTDYNELSRYIIAHAQLETANFSSNLYLKTNNAFGMQVPKKRPFLGSPSEYSEGGMSTNLLKFRNDTQSFMDFVLWLKYTDFPKYVNSSAQYVYELKRRGYFTSSESDYLKGINYYLIKNGNV